MLMYQKTMFDLYYCVKLFCHLKTLKNSFLYFYNGAQKHEGFKGFEKACSRAKTYVILTSLNYVYFYDFNFCDGLECIYVKYKSRASTAQELTFCSFIKINIWKILF